MRGRTRSGRGPSKTKTLNRRIGKDGLNVTSESTYTSSFVSFCKRYGIPTMGVHAKRRRKNA